MLNAFLKPAILLFLYTFPCWVIFRLFFRSKNKGTQRIRQETKFFLLYVYLVFLAAVTVFPVPFARYDNLHARGINLIPVKNTWIELRTLLRVNNSTLIFHAMENIVGNVLLFIPMGFLLPLLFPRIQQFRQILFTGFAVSVLIETTQWLLRFCGIYRFVDIDDVLLNTLGTVIGYFIAQSWLRINVVLQVKHD